MISIPIFAALTLGLVVWGIYAGVQVMQGRDYAYPVVSDYAKRWSGGPALPPSLD